MEFKNLNRVTELVIIITVSVGVVLALLRSV